MDRINYGDPEPPRDTMWETPYRRVLYYRDGGWAFIDEPEDPPAPWVLGDATHFPMTPTTMDGVTFFRTPVTQIK